VKAASRPPEKRNQAAEAAMRREKNGLDERIEKIDARLASAFPQFAEISSPKPVALAQVQALLAEDEALLTYLIWDRSSFVFAVRPDLALVKEIELGEE
jgi:hypothetical protein